MNNGNTDLIFLVYVDMCHNIPSYPSIPLQQVSVLCSALFNFREHHIYRVLENKDSNLVIIEGLVKVFGFVAKTRRRDSSDKFYACVQPTRVCFKEVDIEKVMINKAYDRMLRDEIEEEVKSIYEEGVDVTALGKSSIPYMGSIRSTTNFDFDVTSSSGH